REASPGATRPGGRPPPDVVLRGARRDAPRPAAGAAGDARDRTAGVPVGSRWPARDPRRTALPAHLDAVRAPRARSAAGGRRRSRRASSPAAGVRRGRGPGGGTPARRRHPAATPPRRPPPPPPPARPLARRPPPAPPPP